MNWKIAAVFAVTVACLVWVLWGIDLEKVGASLAAFSWWMLLPMVGCYLAAHLLRAWRLALLLDARPGAYRIVSVNSIGFLAINVMPLRLGELVRPYLFLEQDGVPLGASLAAVFLERILDFMALLGMLLLVGTVVTIPAGGVMVLGVDVVVAGQHLATAVVAAGLLFSALLLIAGAPVIRTLERWERGRWPLARRLIGLMRAFRSGFVQLARTPGRAALVLLLSGLVWAITIGGVWMVLLGSGLEGLDYGSALVIWALTLATMAVAPTPGFFGAYEAACSGALRLLGVATVPAVTLSVVLHLGMFAFIVGTGAVFLVAEGLSLGEIMRRSRSLRVAGP